MIPLDFLEYCVGIGTLMLSAASSVRMIMTGHRPVVPMGVTQQSALTPKQEITVDTTGDNCSNAEKLSRQLGRASWSTPIAPQITKRVFGDAVTEPPPPRRGPPPDDACSMPATAPGRVQLLKDGRSELTNSPPPRALKSYEK